MDNVYSLGICFALLLARVFAKSSDAPMATQCLIQKKREISRPSHGNGVEVHQLDSNELLAHGTHGTDSEIEVLNSLPPPILALGWKLFGNEHAFFNVVQNSVMVNITHAGIQMMVRMNKADDALTRLGEEGNYFSYDLDTMGEYRDASSNLLNMMDIGGNYGVVTIAAFKKYPKSLRVVTVEPIPTTYFFLKWNLYLNGVPELNADDFAAARRPPGVLALNRGTAATDGDDLHLCFDPASSMNARICDCRPGDARCTVVPSVTMSKLMRLFGDESVAMVKMDCEGCEFQALPALSTPTLSYRVRRLAGELHIPDQRLEAIACRWDHGRLMTKCQYTEGTNVACEVPLDCNI
jgi:FkbM family methyltransferase